MCKTPSVHLCGIVNLTRSLYSNQKAVIPVNGKKTPRKCGMEQEFGKVALFHPHSPFNAYNSENMTDEAVWRRWKRGARR